MITLAPFGFLLSRDQVLSPGVLEVDIDGEDVTFNLYYLPASYP